jgi:hypothetical protein
MTDKDREAFEAWVGKGLHLEQIPTGAPFAGDYRNIVMQTRWDAWQAATAAALERAAVACESLGMTTSGIYERNHECASAIRALKDES